MTVEKQEWCRAVPWACQQGDGRGQGLLLCGAPIPEGLRGGGVFSYSHIPPHPLHTPTGLKSRDHGIRAPTLRQALHSAHRSVLSFTSLFLAQREQDQCISWGGQQREPWGNQGSADPLAELGTCYLGGGHGHTPLVPLTFLQLSPPPPRDLPGSLVNISSVDENGHRDRHISALPRSIPCPSWWASASTLTTRELEPEVTRARPTVLEDGGQK